MEEQYATGIATALKSGNCLHIVIPKSVVDILGIENRDRLIVKINKTGTKKPVMRPDLKKHLNQLDKKAEPVS